MHSKESINRIPSCVLDDCLPGKSWRMLGTVNIFFNLHGYIFPDSGKRQHTHIKKTSHTSLLSLFKGILKPAPCFLFLLLLPVSHYLLTCQFSHKVQPSFGFHHSLYGVPHGPCTSLVHMLTDHCSFLPRTCLIAVTVPQSACTAGPLLHSLKTSPAVIISSGSNNSVAQKAGWGELGSMWKLLEFGLPPCCCLLMWLWAQAGVCGGSRPEWAPRWAYVLGVTLNDSQLSQPAVTESQLEVQFESSSFSFLTTPTGAEYMELFLLTFSKL